jgi:hypothetical protein
VLAGLNGAMGDYLTATRNPLAISMSLRQDGKPLILERRALAQCHLVFGDDAGR